MISPPNIAIQGEDPEVSIPLGMAWTVGVAGVPEVITGITWVDNSPDIVVDVAIEMMLGDWMVAVSVIVICFASLTTLAKFKELK